MKEPMDRYSIAEFQTSKKVAERAIDFSNRIKQETVLSNDIQAVKRGETSVW